MHTRLIVRLGCVHAALKERTGRFSGSRELANIGYNMDEASVKCPCGDNTLILTHHVQPLFDCVGTLEKKNSHRALGQLAVKTINCVCAKTRYIRLVCKKLPRSVILDSSNLQPYDSEIFLVYTGDDLAHDGELYYIVSIPIHYT